MRKIDLETRQAFYNCQNYSNNNTRVTVDLFNTRVALHGFTIVTLNHVNDDVIFNLHGWNTLTTRARINACLPDYCNIKQIKGELHFINMRTNKRVKINNKGWYNVTDLMARTRDV